MGYQWSKNLDFNSSMNSSHDVLLSKNRPDASKHAGISYLLIPMDTPGIEIRLVDMTLKAGFNEVFFTDVKIPETNIVGSRGEGWAVANATLGHERGSLAPPDAIMSRLNMLIELMQKETLDGKPLSDDSIYRDRLMKNPSESYGISVTRT